MFFSQLFKHRSKSKDWPGQTPFFVSLGFWYLTPCHLVSSCFSLHSSSTHLFRSLGQLINSNIHSKSTRCTSVWAKDVFFSLASEPRKDSFLVLVGLMFHRSILNYHCLIMICCGKKGECAAMHCQAFFKVVSLFFLQRTGATSVENLTSLRLSCFPTPASAFSGSIQHIGEDNFVMCNTSCRPTSQKDQHSSELVYCSHSTLWQLQPPKWFLTYLRLGIVLCLCWVNHGPWTSTLALEQEIQKTRVKLSFFFK